MTIHHTESLQGDTYIQEIIAPNISVHSSHRGYGAMPELYPKVRFVINGKTYTQTHPWLNLSNKSFIQMGKRKITTRDSWIGHKLVIEDNKKTILVTIKSPFGGFGQRVSQVPLLTVNGHPSGYTLRSLHHDLESFQTKPLFRSNTFQIGLGGEYSQTQEFEFLIERPISPDPEVNTLVTILCFVTLRAWIAKLRLVELVVPWAAQSELSLSS